MFARLIPIPFVASLLLFPTALFGQTMYKWVDADGATHYTTTPPPAEAQSAKTVDLRTPQPSSGPVGLRPGEAALAREVGARLRARDIENSVEANRASRDIEDRARETQQRQKDFLERRD